MDIEAIGQGDGGAKTAAFDSTRATPNFVFGDFSWKLLGVMVAGD